MILTQQQINWAIKHNGVLYMNIYDLIDTILDLQARLSEATNKVQGTSLKETVADSKQPL